MKAHGSGMMSGSESGSGASDVASGVIESLKELFDTDV